MLGISMVMELMTSSLVRPMQTPMVTILAVVMSFMGVARTTPLLMISTFSTSIAVMDLSSTDKMVINPASL